MKKIRIGVIAAAGKGTRAYPRTTFIPKPLFEIQGKTILHRNIELLTEKFGVEKIYILVGYLKEQVVAEIEKIRFFSRKGPELIPSEWTTQGLGADIASLRDRINEPFVTILGDEFYYKTTHENFLKTLQKYPKLSASIGVQKTTLTSRIRKNYSVELNRDKIINLVEKPTDPPNNLLGLGSYLFTPEYFSFYDNTSPSPRSGIIELTDVIDKMAKESKGSVYATQMNCEYFNINSMQDYHHAVYEIRNDQFEKYSVSIVVPTQNHERSISDVLVDFKGKAKEILVIDNGSTDDSVKLAAIEKAKILSLPSDVEQDLGSQVRWGIEQAKGDIVIVVSPDGSFRSKDFPKLLEYLKDSDMVVGTRTTRQMIEQGSNLRPLARLINLFMGKLVEVFWWGQEPRFTDADCHYFGVWKESYNKISNELNEKSRFYVVELMIQFVNAHMRCIEIPVSYYKPVESSDYALMESIKNAWKIFNIILRKKLMPNND
ncbi:sugar phosphate nucleotidyltransferase [Leptospira sp. GIMC2001]|uniref:sugar phosphate nucleotidyltransferase n=1 Tax=Leptospira sp. GIMC2001 TaxID=1513297 RepID=UPI0023495329|nr:sugar phosphate nucleotidyltransferase [Leptospira sp. GIMC2001]WCL47559.1 sugar phosphate nucleotidyltransferase [Leptospira sp. GIMC2001]